MLARFTDLPTLPIVATQVSEMINDPHASSEEIADLLKKDQSLTAKILKLANSSYYSIPGGVTDIHKALTYLGFNTLSQLVLSVSVVGLFKEKGEVKFSFSDFWKHALGVAVTAEVLAKHSGKLKPEVAFTCGLLHDVGKLVLYTLEPGLFSQTVAQAKEQSLSFIEVEKAMDLPTHVELGEAAVKLWKFPNVIGLAIKHHHDEYKSLAQLPESHRMMCQVVWISNQYCVTQKIGNSADYSGGTLEPFMYNKIGINTEQLPDISDEIRVSLDKAGAFLNA
ncbi:MAG: HDOD domain-containing protein [Xanthomonadaceae bacterium]|nr:HDOD domain-containing protein [Xanthomonadaceae bacterium]